MTIAWLSRTVPVAPDALGAALGAPFRVVVDGGDEVTETPDVVVATTLDPPELLRSLGSRPAGVRAAVLPAPGVPLSAELWTAARPDAVTALAGVDDVAGLVRGLATAQVWLGGGGAVTGDTQVLGADRPWWDSAAAAAPVAAVAGRSRWTRRRTVPLALAAVAALVLALVLFATVGGNGSSNASSGSAGATQSPGTTSGGSGSGSLPGDGSGDGSGDGTLPTTPTTPSTPGAPDGGTATGPQADALLACLRQQGIVVVTPGQSTEGMRQATRAEVRKALEACQQQLGGSGSGGSSGSGTGGTTGGGTTGTTT